MRPLLLLVSLLLSITLLGPAGVAAETVLWQLGKPDLSDHEFASWPEDLGEGPVIVRLGSGNAERLWPKFQPGSGNGSMGGRPHPYTLVFNLVQPSRGAYYLTLNLIFRHPRVPVLQVEINDHIGNYYLNPKLSLQLGDETDAFNPIHSAEEKRIELPAEYFQAGGNRLTLTCLDEPPTVTRNVSVGGPGDSGIFYDSLSLSQDPGAAFADRLDISFEPTVFYRQSGGKLVEECWLTVHSAEHWRGGKARLTLGAFTTEIAAPKNGEFGEARYRAKVPDGVGAGVARIELTGPGLGRGGQSFSVDFAPRRKWKIFYAPSEHLDIGFTDYQAKVAEVQSRQLDALLDVNQAHPDYRFNLDGSWIVQRWLETRSEEQVRRFTDQARAGQIGVNAFYASFLTQLLSLEELYRGMYFSKTLETRFGVPFDTAFITDVPSYSWSLPSALAGSGVRYFAGGGNQTRGPLLALGRWHLRSPFWWQGPDGQRVLALWSYHYHQLRALFGIPPAIDAGREGVPRFLQAFERNNYAPDAVLLYGTEVENVPLDFQDAELVKQWNAEYAYPKIILCRFGEFFRYIEENYGSNLPTVRGDTGGYWEDGAGTDAASTSRYRATQARAQSAESLDALTASLNPRLRFPLEPFREVWRNLLLYAEHTFTSYRGPGEPEHDEVVGQWEVKRSRTVRADQDTDDLMRLGLSQLADRIRTSGEDLIVFNPLSWRRSGLVRFQVPTGATLTDVAGNSPVAYEVAEEHEGYQTIRFWARDVPSMGYKVYRLGSGEKILPRRSEPESNVFQNKFYRVTLDPTRGAIKSIYDKELGHELVDASSPYLLNEFLYVTGGGSEQGRGDGAEATQLTHLASHLPYAELTIHHPEDGQVTSVQKTAWGHVVRFTARALNTPRIETEIFLADDEKRIDIINRVRKDLTYAKEAVYFAFPWAVASPTFRYDIANGWVNPQRDLLKGGASEWFAAQNWVNVEGGGAALTLAVLDAPLVSLGDINRGRWPAEFSPKSPAVFSYAMNNYWFTNAPAGQSGDFVFRYAITSGRQFDAEKASRFAREARSPLEVSHLRPTDKQAGRETPPTILPPGEASLVEIKPENLAVSTLKGAEDGKGLVVRVVEIAGKETEGKLTFPWLDIASAREANGVEVAGSALPSDARSISVKLKPHQVLTIRVTTQ